MATNSVREPATRLEAAWLHLWWVLFGAIVAAAAVAVLITRSPTRFSATASVRVSVAQTRAGQHEAALGSDELAAQYALLADSQPVRQAAQKLLGSTVLGTVSASPTSGYNLISLTAVARDPVSAGDQASAVATALVTYLRNANASQAAGAVAAAVASAHGLQSEINTLNYEISVLRSQFDGPLSLDLVALQGSLSDAVTARQTLISSSTEDVTGGTPDVRTIDPPTSGTAVRKHRTEYSLIAFAVGLLVAIELSYLTTTLAGKKASRHVASHPLSSSNGQAAAPKHHTTAVNRP